MLESYEDHHGEPLVEATSTHERCHDHHSLARPRAAPASPHVREQGRPARDCTGPCAAGPITNSESRVPNSATTGLAAARMSTSRVSHSDDPEHTQQDLRRRRCVSSNPEGLSSTNALLRVGDNRGECDARFIGREWRGVQPAVLAVVEWGRREAKRRPSKRTTEHAASAHAVESQSACADTTIGNALSRLNGLTIISMNSDAACH